jgi:hypothetical protein
MCGQQPSCYPIGYQLNARINCPNSSPCLPCRMKSIKENEGQYPIFVWYFEHKSYITITYTSMKRIRLKVHFLTPILQFYRSFGSLIANRVRVKTVIGASTLFRPSP